MPKPTIEIDGSRFDSLSGFWDEISARVIPGAAWGRNLDAFDDILRSGFGTPKGGFRLRWVNFERSREALGYPETIVRLSACFKNATQKMLILLKRP